MKTNILGIDPGRNTGITALTVEMDMETGKYYPTYMYNHTVVMVNNKKLPDKLVDLKMCVHNAMLIFQPSLIVMESAFLNVRFPRAVIVLTEYIQAIRDMIYHYNRNANILNLPPKMVKKLSSGVATATKEDMKVALRSTVLGPLVSDERLEEMTEHDVDSAMIALSGMMWLNQEFTI